MRLTLLAMPTSDRVSFKGFLAQSGWHWQSLRLRNLLNLPNISAYYYSIEYRSDSVGPSSTTRLVSHRGLPEVFQKGSGNGGLA